MTVMAVTRSQLEEQARWSTGKTKLKPGPRKNEPMITSTAQNMRKTVKSEMANLRSSGLLLGLRSM